MAGEESGQEARETLTDEQREDLGDKFDKTFRRLDSRIESLDGEGMSDGDVLTTVFALRRLLRRLDLSFGAVLDMAAGGGNNDRILKLEESLKAFEEANACLKTSELFLVQENARLERLLRAGQENPSFMASANALSPEEFRQQTERMAGMLDDAVARIEAALSPPGRLQQQRLTHYEARIGAALAAEAPQADRGMLVSGLLRLLGALGCDLKPGTISDMKQIIREQKHALEESQKDALIRPLQEAERFMRGVVLPSLDLAAPDAVPRPLFDNLQKQAAGLEADVVRLEFENAELKNKNDEMRAAEELRRAFGSADGQEKAEAERKKMLDEQKRLEAELEAQRKTNAELEERMKAQADADRCRAEEMKALRIYQAGERGRNMALANENAQMKEDVFFMKQAMIEREKRALGKGSLLLAAFLGAVLSVPATVLVTADRPAPEPAPVPRTLQKPLLNGDAAGTAQDRVSRPDAPAATFGR